MLDPINNEKHLSIILAAGFLMLAVAVSFFMGNAILGFLSISFVIFCVLFYYLLPGETYFSEKLVFLVLFSAPRIEIAIIISFLLNLLGYYILDEWIG